MVAQPRFLASRFVLVVRVPVAFVRYPLRAADLLQLRLPSFGLGRFDFTIRLFECCFQVQYTLNQSGSSNLTPLRDTRVLDGEVISRS